MNFQTLKAGQKEPVEIDSKLPYKAFYYMRFKEEHHNLSSTKRFFVLSLQPASKILKFKYDLLVEEGS